MAELDREPDVAQFVAQCGQLLQLQIANLLLCPGVQPQFAKLFDFQIDIRYFRLLGLYELRVLFFERFQFLIRIDCIFDPVLKALQSGGHRIVQRGNLQLELIDLGQDLLLMRVKSLLLFFQFVIQGFDILVQFSGDGLDLFPDCLHICFVLHPQRNCLLFQRIDPGLDFRRRLPVVGIQFLQLFPISFHILFVDRLQRFEPGVVFRLLHPQICDSFEQLPVGGIQFVNLGFELGVHCFQFIFQLSGFFPVSVVQRHQFLPEVRHGDIDFSGQRFRLFPNLRLQRRHIAGMGLAQVGKLVFKRELLILQGIDLFLQTLVAGSVFFLKLFQAAVDFLD